MHLSPCQAQIIAIESTHMLYTYKEDLKHIKAAQILSDFTQVTTT
jgi:hypothetical protein